MPAKHTPRTVYDGERAYKDWLDFILEKNGGKAVFTPAEAARATGLDARTLKKRYPFRHGTITATTLARLMS